MASKRLSAVDARNEKEEQDVINMSAVKIAATCIIHAFVLGDILTFGLFTTSLSLAMGGISSGSVIFIGDMKYLIFLCSGIVVGPLRNQNPARYSRPLSIVGCILWSLGLGLTVPFETNYSTFAGLYVALSGLGAGMLYWNTMAMIPSWCTRSTYPIAFFVVSLSPYLYTVVFASVVANITPTSPTSLWSDVYVGTSSLASVVVFICSLIVTPAQFSKDLASGPHDSPVTLLLFFLGVYAYQTAYYVPFVHVSQYMTVGLGESEEHAAYVMNAIGGGSMAGKFVLFPLTIAMEHSFGDLGLRGLTMLTTLGTAITLFSWLACTSSTSMVIFAVFYGLFSAGTMMAMHYLCSVSWMAWDYTTRTAWLALARTLGEATAAFTVRFGLVDSGINAPIYFSASFAMFAAVVFCVMTIRG